MSSTEPKNPEGRHRRGPGPATWAARRRPPFKAWRPGRKKVSFLALGRSKDI